MIRLSKKSIETFSFINYKKILKVNKKDFCLILLFFYKKGESGNYE